MAKKKDGLSIMLAVGKPKPGAVPPDEGFSDEEAPPEEEGAYPEEGAEPPPEEEESEGAYPEFTIPEGLDLSDIEPGEEKQVLCTIGKTADDTACIKQVDGVDLAGLSQGMYGPPPAPPPGGPPPPGPPGLPPPEMMMGPGGPPPPGLPVRRRAAAAGLM